jgi:predicted nucleotidyltransferase
MSRVTPDRPLTMVVSDRLRSRSPGPAPRVVRLVHTCWQAAAAPTRGVRAGADADCEDDVTTSPPLPASVVAGMAAMPVEYQPLLVGVRDVLERDRRILALFLGGSIGRGVADAGSDLDLLVTVADADLEAVAVELAGMLAVVVDPVISLPIPGMPGSQAYTTRSGLRVDVVLEQRSDVDRPAFRRRVTVFDRDDVRALLSPAVDANAGPSVEALAAIVQEFLRQQAMFPAVVARGDWLLGQEGVHNARLMLYQLFVETNQPLPAMGVKQWSSKLTAAQKFVLEGLVLPAAAREPVVAAMRAVRAAFRTSGRVAAEAAGLAWPTEVDDAIAAHWSRSGFTG